MKQDIKNIFKLKGKELSKAITYYLTTNYGTTSVSTSRNEDLLKIFDGNI